MEEKRKSVFEASADRRAIEAWREDEDGALAGHHLYSAEADPAAQEAWLASPNRKKSKMMFELALTEPVRFLELTSKLPHFFQDIFYQYFLLGRTQTQIGTVLGVGQTAIWQALEIGVDAVVGLMALEREGTDKVKAQLAVEKATQFRVNPETTKELVIEEPGFLGSFFQSMTEAEIEVLFAPVTPDWTATVE